MSAKNNIRKIGKMQYNNWRAFIKMLRISGTSLKG